MVLEIKVSKPLVTDFEKTFQVQRSEEKKHNKTKKNWFLTGGKLAKAPSSKSTMCVQIWVKFGLVKFGEILVRFAEIWGRFGELLGRICKGADSSKSTMCVQICQFIQ